jgi:CIC family chloride channel protein
LFVVEVLYRDDFEVDALVPAVLSSVVAYSVFTMIFGEGNIFATADHYPFDPRQLPLYLVMAAAAALIGVFYVKVFYGARDHVFSRLRVPQPIKPMLGCLAVGAIALVVPQAFGAGYGWLQEAILPSRGLLPLGWVGAATLLGFALAKVLTTTLTVSSGGSGGVFGPSVVIGGMIGGAFGLAWHQLFPDVVPEPGAFVIVGMACFFGGVAHAPISSLVMASEMTGSYDLLVPIMLAEAVAVVMMGRFTLYERQVPTRRESPAHGGEYVLDLLQDVPVSSAFRSADVIAVAPSTPLTELLRQASESAQQVFPVTSETGGLTGIVTLDTLRAVFLEQDIGTLAIAADCASPFVAVTLDDSLGVALERFARSRYPELPVIDASDSSRLVGLLSYDRLLQVYSQELMRRRTEAEDRQEPSSSHPAPEGQT